MQNTFWRNNNRRVKTSLKKYTSHFIWKGSHVRASWRPNKIATYWTPLLWPSALCLSRSTGLLNRRPEGLAFCWVLFSLLHLVSNSFDLQLTDFLFTELYNSSIADSVSLEWHVCSSSSGNNCHAVHWSLSSGASVYECTMGFLPCPISSAKSAYAISSHNCHRNVSLRFGASLWNGMFGRVEGQYTTQWKWFSNI